MPTAKADYSRPTHDIKLSDGETTIGLMLAGGKGTNDPLAITRNPYPRTSTKIATGGRHDHDGGNGDRDREEHGHGHHHDHNLRSAYLHVLADALTSLLAIFALLAAKYLGLIWMDPTMGVLGAVLVSWWSLALLRTSSGVLLDRRGPDALQAKIRARIESDGDNRVADHHLWLIGPSVYGVNLTVVSHDPRPPGHYKQLLPCDSSLAHVTVEVHQCSDGPGTELGQRAAMGAGR